MKPLNLEIHFNDYGVNFYKKTKQYKTTKNSILVVILFEFFLNWILQSYML